MAGKKNGGWKRRFDTGGAGVSGCLRTISHFTYEMVIAQGKIAMDGNVIKLGFENN